MDVLFTVNNTVKLFLFYHIVNSISTVPPVVNSKTLHVDMQFPTKTFSVKTVDCMFYMQIPVKLKHKSLCRKPVFYQTGKFGECKNC